MNAEPFLYMDELPFVLSDINLAPHQLLAGLMRFEK
jgi:hypothetical protein